jgi:hypothetical protein
MASERILDWNLSFVRSPYSRYVGFSEDISFRHECIGDFALICESRNELMHQLLPEAASLNEVAGSKT